MTRPLVFIGVARAMSLAFGVLLLAVLGRRLGTSGFGTLQLALAVMAYPLLLIDMGLTTYGLREIAKGAPSPDLIGHVLGARLALLAGIMVVLAACLWLIPLSAELQAVLVVLSLALPAAVWNVRWVLQGERHYGRAAAIDVATTGMQLLAVLVLVNDGGSARSAAGALTVAAWTTTVVSLALAGNWARFRPALGAHVPTVIWRGLPLGAAAIAITVYYSFDTILLGIFRGGDEVAYYAAAYRIILPVLMLAGAVGTVAIPEFTLLVSRGGSAAAASAAGLARELIVWAVPMAIGGALTAEPIIRLVYGPEFGPAVVPFQILVWSILTVYANAAFAFLLLARGGDRRYLAAVASGAAINIGVNLLVIPVAGMVGAALTTIVSEVTVLGILAWWTRDTSATAIASALRAAAIPTVAMTLVVVPLRDSILSIPLGGAVYVMAGTLTGTLPTRAVVARLTGRRAE